MESAKIYDFPCYLEDEIRLNDASHWICFETYGSMFTCGKTYSLEFNEWTGEWFVFDNQGKENYAFYVVEGKYVNLKTEDNKNRQKNKACTLRKLLGKIFS